MNITVTFRDGSGENIIQIDQRQELWVGLRILQETGKTTYAASPDFFRSEALGKVVSAYLSFEDLGIFSGDILTAIDKQQASCQYNERKRDGK